MPTCADYGGWVISIIAGRFEVIADNLGNNRILMAILLAVILTVVTFTVIGTSIRQSRESGSRSQ